MASFLELVEHLIEEPLAKSAYLADPHGYLSAHGFAGFEPGDVAEALRHTADAFPPSLAAHVNPLDGLDHLVHMHLHDVGLQSFDDYHAPWEHGDDVHGIFHDLAAEHHDFSDLHGSYDVHGSSDLHSPLFGAAGGDVHAVDVHPTDVHAADAHAADAHAAEFQAAGLHPLGHDAGHFVPGEADLRHDVDLDSHHPSGPGDPFHGDQPHLVGTQAALDHLDHGSADVAHHDDSTHGDLGHTELAHADLAHSDLGHPDLGHDDLSHSDLGNAELMHNLTHVDLPHDDLTHIDSSHDPLDEHHWASDHPIDHGHVDDPHLADHDAFGHDPGTDLHHH